MAIKTAPGVLAVKVDYPSGRAIIGTAAGTVLSQQEIFAALDKIGYGGEFIQSTDDRDGP